MLRFLTFDAGCERSNQAARRDAIARTAPLATVTVRTRPAGGEPKEMPEKLAATAPNRNTTLPSPSRLSPGPPPRSCSSSCAAASSGPATDAARPVTTGATLTRTATGPRSANSASSYKIPYIKRSKVIRS